MSSSLTITEQHLLLTGITSVSMTEIVGVEGGFTRAVRFFGSPTANVAPRLILDVTLTAPDRASLEVSTPVLQF